MTVRSDWNVGQPLFRGVVNDDNDHHVVVQVDRYGIGYRLFHAGSRADAVVLTPRAAALAARMPVKAPPDMSKYLLSPMPGCWSLWRWSKDKASRRAKCSPWSKR